MNQKERLFFDSFASIEWKTLMLVVGCYGLWIAAGIGWSFSYGWLCLPVLAVLSAFQTSLQHETIHGHPTRWNWLNELLVSVPLAVVFPYRRYRDLHLAHHNDANLTDPYEDPESYFWPLSTFNRMRPFVKRVFAFNNTLVGRLLVGPLLSVIGFGRTEFHRLLVGEPGVRMSWLLHVPGLIVLAFIVTQIFAMPFWMYCLFVVYPAMSLISLRSYAEHQAAENVGGRSAVVESCPSLALLYLNNNLHIVHHASPQTPWYELPALYQERRDQYLAANGHLLFNGYWEIFRRFAFTVKQPVDHPFMYRQNSHTE